MPRPKPWALFGLLALACQKPAPTANELPPNAAAVQVQSSTSATNPVQQRPAAVLELFTSEGCSSCPPADEALAAITDRAKAEGRRVFTLELHVDYWDYLGWSDPFGSPLHGRRQSAYAERFGKIGIYTPQLVVNGRYELVGSDSRGAQARIEEALAETPRASVTVDARHTPDGVEVTYRVDTPTPIDLRLAVADDRAQTRVLRGENADRQLVHRHVVRAFETRPLSASSTGTWLVHPPAGTLRDQIFIAAYATDPKTLAVIGADATELRAGS